ncbi:MAG: substrate-binding domain-containing protein [Leptolyngbyaceae cyanobacterium bins.59]|nr:substrate-binding domain-containing protein [Leptolyngbyaceae cyanobacterium bins.59]
MAAKNETPALILALLITVGVIGGGVWWFTSRTGLNLNQWFNRGSGQSSPSPNPTGQGRQFTDVANVPSGLFNYGGSTTWATIRRDVDSKIQTAFPGFQLRYTDPPSGAPGSTVGIRMLLRNQLSFAQSSRSLSVGEYQQAQQQGLSLKEIPVAIDGIAVAVNPRLTVPGLTIAQLQAIYLGKIRNWKALGGPNLPILPLSRRVSDGGTIEFFQETILEGKNFGPTVRFVGTTTEALRQVDANSGAIYYASAPEVVGQCKIRPLPVGRQANQLVAPYQNPLIPPSQCPSQRNQLNSEVFRSGQYPITRNLFVVIKQNGGIEQQSGEAYANLLLTDQGQELLSQIGFVRIR